MIYLRNEIDGMGRKMGTIGWQPRGAALWMRLVGDFTDQLLLTPNPILLAYAGMIGNECNWTKQQLIFGPLSIQFAYGCLFDLADQSQYTERLRLHWSWANPLGCLEFVAVDRTTDQTPGESIEPFEDLVSTDNGNCPFGSPGHFEGRAEFQWGWPLAPPQTWP